MTEDHRDDLIYMMTVFPRKIHAVGKIVVLKYLKDSRLKPNHLMVISKIGRAGGISQKDLGEALPFDKSYISTTVRELIDMGFARNDSGGKVHSLYLTDTGKDVLVMSEVLYDMVEKTLFDVLTQEEKDSVATLMKKVDARCDEILANHVSKEVS